MNKKYKERMKCADDAAEHFFKLAQKPGNIGMLQNDSEIFESFILKHLILSVMRLKKKRISFSISRIIIYIKAY